jgi:uncharacterized protein (TIGR02271 family)
MGPDGLHGRLLDPVPADLDANVRVELDDGRIVELPARLVASTKPGGEVETETVVPVLAEELDVRRTAVPTGGVRVHRRILEHEEELDIPLVKEHVDIHRVVIGREVDGPLAVRQDGEVTIIPVVEEELVLQRRFVLKEEIHVTKTAREERHRESVTVRRQEAVVEEIDEQGRGQVITPPTQKSEAPPRSVARPRRAPRRSILE